MSSQIEKTVNLLCELYELILRQANRSGLKKEVDTTDITPGCIRMVLDVYIEIIYRRIDKYTSSLYLKLFTGYPSVCQHHPCSQTSFTLFIC